MIIRIVMPKIDANIDEGTVGPWIRQEGQAFKKGDPLVEIITDKATFELEAEQDGILRRIIAREKSTIPIGYILALASQEPDETLPDVEEENSRVLEAFQEKSGLRTDLQDEVERPGPYRHRHRRQAGRDRPARRVRATPAARRLARERNVDLTDIPNPEQRMLSEEDVRSFIEGEGNP